MKITFDAKGLSAVRQADQSVTMARSVDLQVGPFVCVSAQDSADARPISVDIAWQAFTPAEINRVAWSTAYVAIVSLMTPEVGKDIFINAQIETPLGSGCVYNNGHLSPGSACDPDKIAITNASQDSPLSFGLAQRADINGTIRLSPICLVAVLGAETAIFKPHPDTKLFLSSNLDAGVIIPRLRPMVEFGPDGDLVYDDRSASFHAAP